MSALIVGGYVLPVNHEIHMHVVLAQSVYENLPDVRKGRQAGLT